MPNRIEFNSDLTKIADKELAEHILTCMRLQADLDAECERIGLDIQRRTALENTRRRN